jgi:type I restriction enzyme, S subunit
MTQSDIGVFPTNWSIQRVDSLFNIQQGKSVSKAHREGNNQRPFLRTKNILWGRIDLSELDEMNFTIDEETRLQLKAGDLLLCEGGDVGRTAIWGDQMGNCYYQNHLHRLRAKVTCEIDPQFALYWFWYAFEVADVYIGRSNVTTIPNLSQSKLGELQLPVPELEEQRRIAQMLKTVQTAIEQQARMIALTRELKSALMHKLFTEGLRGEKQKGTEIGLVPESWRIEKIKDNARVKGGKRLPKGEHLVDEKTHYPYLRVTDFEDNSINTVGLKYLTPETQEQIKRYTITDKDVFISIAGTIGVTGMITPELNGANLTENAAKIVLETKLLSPRFLMYFLSTDGAQREIQSQTVKNAQPKLALVRIESLKTPIPGLVEQEEITQILDTLRRKIISLKQKRTLFEELFRTLLHQLMTGQTRVNSSTFDFLDKLEENGHA